MLKTIYSHAFFVGRFNGKINPERLDSRIWEHCTIDEEMYNEICTQYYQGHVDAMIEHNSTKPDFLKSVRHYKYSFIKKDNVTDKDVNGINLGKACSLKLKNNSIFNFYVHNLHLFFFPLDIVFIAVEIDDSNTDLNDLTLAHSDLSGWTKLFYQNGQDSAYPAENEPFLSILDSLKEFLPNHSIKNILGNGNKFKIFQTIQIDTLTIEDSKLYEIGTSSPIGCVGTDHWLAPSDDYYNSIIKQNSVSAFKNWKGLALMDSFTMLCNQNQWWRNWNELYFPLIYMRCIFEKTFCFSRNTAYRMGSNVENLSQEIKEMEKYYFYNNISYNFLPNLLYEAVAKGMGLSAERQELSNQVHERAKDEHDRLRESADKRMTLIAILLSAFAIFSAVWDLCSLFLAAFSVRNPLCVAKCFFCCGIIIAVITLGFLRIKKVKK